MVADNFVLALPGMRPRRPPPAQLHRNALSDLIDWQSVNCECKSRVAVPRFPSTGIVILLGLARRTSQQIENVSLFYRHVGNLVVDEPCPVRTVMLKSFGPRFQQTTNRGLACPRLKPASSAGWPRYSLATCEMLQSETSLPLSCWCSAPRIVGLPRVPMATYPHALIFGNSAPRL